MAPKPLDERLYAVVKAEADKLFLAPTSAYKSGWIVRTYKKRGGTYEAPSNPPTKRTGLVRWFAEKWVDINRPILNAKGMPTGKFEACGREKAMVDGKYPLCRPSKHITKESPKTPGELSAAAIAKAKVEKQKVKNRGRIQF